MRTKLMMFLNLVLALKEAGIADVKRIGGEALDTLSGILENVVTAIDKLTADVAELQARPATDSEAMAVLIARVDDLQAQMKNLKDTVAYPLVTTAARAPEKNPLDMTESQAHDAGKLAKEKNEPLTACPFHANTGNGRMSYLLACWYAGYHGEPMPAPAAA